MLREELDVNQKITGEKQIVVGAGIALRLERGDVQPVALDECNRLQGKSL
jgi:hypothetical protein